MTMCGCPGHKRRGKCRAYQDGRLTVHQVPHRTLSSVRYLVNDEPAVLVCMALDAPLMPWACAHVTCPQGVRCTRQPCHLRTPCRAHTLWPLHVCSAGSSTRRASACGPSELRVRPGTLCDSSSWRGAARGRCILGRLSVSLCSGPKPVLHSI